MEKKLYLKPFIFDEVTLFSEGSQFMNENNEFQSDSSLDINQYCQTMSKVTFYVIISFIFE